MSYRDVITVIKLRVIMCNPRVSTSMHTRARGKVAESRHHAACVFHARLAREADAGARRAARDARVRRAAL